MSYQTLAPPHILSRFFSFRDHPNSPSFWSAKSGLKSYNQIMSDIQSMRLNLEKIKIRRHEPCLLLFHFSYEFLILLFALLAEGALPVLIDPRVNRRDWKTLAKKAKVRVIFLSRETRLARFIFFPSFGFTYVNIEDLSFSKDSIQLDRPLVQLSADDPILLSFTSGTTGEPKVISRTLGVLGSQQTLFCKYLAAVSGESHLALHGIGVIQSLIQGSPTYYVPPSEASAETLESVMKTYSISTLSLPPGTLDIFIATSASLPATKFIITGGAPLPRWLIEKTLDLLPQSLLVNVYASTECEPMSLLGFSKTPWPTPQPFETICLKDYPDTNGYPVGPLISELKSHPHFLPSSPNKFFELKLFGPNCVTRDQNGFQSGDILFQQNQMLFYCGRRNDQIWETPTGPIEDFLERKTPIKRAAIKLIKNKLYIFIEPHADKKISKETETEITNHLSSTFNKTLTTQEIEFKYIKKIPVDPRHLWKIQRQSLTPNM